MTPQLSGLQNRPDTSPHLHRPGHEDCTRQGSLAGTVTARGGHQTAACITSGSPLSSSLHPSDMWMSCFVSCFCCGDASGLFWGQEELRVKPCKIHSTQSLEARATLAVLGAGGEAGYQGAPQTRYVLISGDILGLMPVEDISV